MEVDTASLSLQCHFQSGVTGITSCVVHYGSDPTYQNLPFENQMSRSLTNGGIVTVPLTHVQSVGSDDVYYNVLAQTDSQSVRVVGCFQVGQWHMYES